MKKVVFSKFTIFNVTGVRVYVIVCQMARDQLAE